MIKGSFLILLHLFIGETISLFINNIMPGSVLGMILLFISLFFKLIKPDDVRLVATFLTRNMAIFFITASIGIMKSWKLISMNWFSLTFISVATTILVIIVVAIIQEKSEKLNQKKNE